jgi:hypothetical protein
MTRWTVLFFLALQMAAFSSCDDGFGGYSDRRGDLLSFSTDTVAFDTIISTIITPYQGFKVYNRNGKALLISSVSMENGEDSPFRINVDGAAGSVFRDVELRANDSLYVLVDARPAENGVDEPRYLLDRVVFVTHDVKQTVVVEATSQDAEIWRGRTIGSDTIIGGRKPYVVYDSLVIREGARVEVLDGVRFYMHGNAEVVVWGSLCVRGLRDNPVLFRGDRFDYYLNITYDRVPGQWGGIRFGSESFDNEWENVFVRNGKFGMDFERSDTLRSKMRMRNVVLTNFKGFGLRAVNSRVEAENCEFSNTKDVTVDLYGGVYGFIHCTIANYYRSYQEAGWGNSDNATVRLMGVRPDEATGEREYFPVLRASFYNSVIWGNNMSGRSAISIDRDEKSVVIPFFLNCLIPNSGPADGNPNDDPAFVVSCVAGVDPRFRLTDSPDLIYDFRLDSLSPARNIADRTIAQRLPEDPDGHSRLSDEGPDMGAYEFVPIVER